MTRIFSLSVSYMLNKQTASMIISVLVNKNETPGFSILHFLLTIQIIPMLALDKYFESPL